MQKIYSTIGQDIEIDFYGVKVDAINDLFLLKMLVKKAIELCGAEIISFDHKCFEPHGITLNAILSESSFSIHTYKEHDYCSISCYTCGDLANPIVAIAFLMKVLNPEHINGLRIERGNREGFKYQAITKESLMGLK